VVHFAHDSIHTVYLEKVGKYFYCLIAVLSSCDVHLKFITYELGQVSYFLDVQNLPVRKIENPADVY
jgi:hypothetical protein